MSDLIRQPNVREIYSALVFWTERTIALEDWSAKFWERFPAANLDLIYPDEPELPEALLELCANRYPLAQAVLSAGGIPLRDWRRIRARRYDAALIVVPSGRDAQPWLKLCAVIKPDFLLLLDERLIVTPHKVPPILSSQLFSRVFWSYTLHRALHTAGFGLLLVLAALQACFHRRKPEADT